MSETNNKHSVSTFQDEWLCDENYSSWIAKAPRPTQARCVLCKKNADLALMGVSALTSHATGLEHKSKLPESQATIDIRTMFGVQKKQTDTNLSNQATHDKNKEKDVTMIDNLIVNKENTLNAEILWCLKMVLSHDSYHSCNDLLSLFKRMFPDSE